MLSTKNIWLIFGLSGSGKTYFCNYLCKRNNWLHLNFDRLGLIMTQCLDIYGLKPVWILFEEKKIAKPLIEEITKQFQDAGKCGAALSFPSDYPLDIDMIKLLIQDVNVVFLASTKSNCLTSFLRREELEPRIPSSIDKVSYWDQCNKELLYYLSTPAMMPYRFETFNQDGTRKSAETIYDEIING